MPIFFNKSILHFSKFVFSILVHSKTYKKDVKIDYIDFINLSQMQSFRVLHQHFLLNVFYLYKID